MITLNQKFCAKLLVFLSLFQCMTPLHATQLRDLLRLKKAYPEQIQSVTRHYIIWTDGTVMPTKHPKQRLTLQEKIDNPSLFDQVDKVRYKKGIPYHPESFQPDTDPGRIRYEPFFRKMYGNSEADVQSKLVTIYWMPKLFGNSYPLLVTTVNNVDQKLTNISNDLEKLVSKHPKYIPFLMDPEGTFKWRMIANTNRLSNHSFGMTIDINSAKSDYWQWELIREKKPVTEDAPLIYRNHVPWKIVTIFEKYGFIWGGKWHHYDSMHFEYRPELMIK